MARIINRNDGTTRILLGIREDALFRLDERMSLRVPNLVENTLQLKHLTAASARDAIEKPVAVFNQTVGEAFEIGPGLADTLLEQRQGDEDGGAGPGASARRTASALNHPNIVIIHEIESWNGIDFLVMEYVAGKSLDALIPRTGMRIEEVLKLALQVSGALAIAHSVGITHRGQLAEIER